MAGNYVVLARKYRPQTFEDIVGQAHVTATLQKAISGNRVHHAYLFSGIRGVGKTTAARVLAKALNCVHGPTPNPCNECQPCVEITAGRAMDVIEMDAASNRGIDDIRELRDGVRYSTNRDRFRVLIIDEVHMLTEAAFNALLKTLEEPPAHVRFILATTDPQKVPATILSRCQRFDFRRVSAGDMVAHLASICRQEGIQAEEGALAVVVRQTTGSVRDCLSLLDQLLAGVDGKLTEAYARELLGIADGARVLDTIRAMLDGNTGAALRSLRSVYVSGLDIQVFMGELLQKLRDLMVYKAVGRNNEVLDATDGEFAELDAATSGRSLVDMHFYFQIFLRAMEEITRSEYPLFAAEEALVRVASAGSVADIGKLLERIEGLSASGIRDVPLAPRPTPPQALDLAPPPVKEALEGSNEGAKATQVAPQVAAAEAEAERPTRSSPPEKTTAAPAADISPSSLVEREESVQVDAGLGGPEIALPGVVEEPAVDAGASSTGASPLSSAPSRSEQADKVADAGRGLAGNWDNSNASDDDYFGNDYSAKAVVAASPSGEDLLALCIESRGGFPEFWAAFAADLVERKDPLTSRIVEESLLGGFAGRGCLRVRVPKGLSGLLKLEEIEAHLAQFAGCAVRVVIAEESAHELDGSLASQRRSKNASVAQERTAELKSQEKVVESLSLFGATIRAVIPDVSDLK